MIHDPFPHLIIDGLFPPARLRRMAAEFPAPDWLGWHRYDSPGEHGKLACRNTEKLPLALADFVESFNSPQICRWVAQACGLPALLPDHGFRGGGLHVTLPGGFLGLHADSTIHAETGLERRVNLILYLTEDWQPAWGGDLELWDRDRLECQARIAPLFNRLVIFECGPTHWHGCPSPLRCPPGVSRKSIAVFYYTGAAKRARFVRPADAAPDAEFDQWAEARSR